MTMTREQTEIIKLIHRMYKIEKIVREIERKLKKEAEASVEQVNDILAKIGGLV